MVKAYQHLSASFAGVTPHRLRRSFRFTRGDLVENLMILAIETLHFSPLHQAKARKEANFY
jgi:hypothetical protein